MRACVTKTRATVYVCVHTLRLLLRGDPQDEGLGGLQPRARLSKQYLSVVFQLQV